MHHREPPRKASLFYGYWVLASCFLCAVISNGSGLSTFSVFIKEFQANFGWNRTEIMAAYTIFVFIIAITSPFAGRLAERHGVRKVILTGSLVTATGFILLSCMNSLWHFYIGNILIGAGTTATGPLTLSYVVSNWFLKRRGLAISVMAMGVSISGFVFAPLIAVWLIPDFGLSHTFLILALINAGVIVPLTVLVLRTRPADMGLYPDGIKTLEHQDNVTEQSLSRVSGGLTLEAALKTRAFWFIGLYLVLNHSYMGVLHSAFPHLTDFGFSAAVGATVIGLTSVAGTFGMFFFGWLSDRIATRYMSTMGLGVLTLGILIIINIGPGSPLWLIWLYALVMGFGCGCWLPSMSMLISTTFGMAHYGSIFGTLALFQHAGGGTGPLLAGYVFDSTQSYHWAFISIMAAQIIAVPVVLKVRRPSPKKEEPEK